MYCFSVGISYDLSHMFFRFIICPNLPFGDSQQSNIHAVERFEQDLSWITFTRGRGALGIVWGYFYRFLFNPSNSYIVEWYLYVYQLYNDMHIFIIYKKLMAYGQIRNRTLFFFVETKSVPSENIYWVWS